MSVQLYPAAKRQHVRHGDKFDSWQSFSFGGWRDDARMNFGALRVFNDDTIGHESEIGMHPHQNFEILSVMLDGRMSHQDNLGHYQEIETDAIQLISCGTGIYHAGKNLAAHHRSSFLQIWVSPAVFDTPPDLQLRQFSAENAFEKWDLRVSPHPSSDKIQIRQNCFCSRGVFQQNTYYPLYDPQNAVWLFVLDGEIELDSIKATRRDALMVSNLAKFDLTIHAAADLWLMELPLKK
jgi:quercetin 2,3-dioxygenase